MPYDYLSAGTQRITNQAYLLPTGNQYSYRIYNVTAVGSSPNVQVQIAQITPEGPTTTNVSTAYISVPLNNSGSNLMLGSWDSHYGTLIDGGGALVHTCAGFSYATVTFSLLKR